jgi:hypothetical protein
MHFCVTENQKYEEFEIKPQTLKTVANVTQLLLWLTRHYSSGGYQLLICQKNYIVV